MLIWEREQQGAMPSLKFCKIWIGNFHGDHHSMLNKETLPLTMELNRIPFKYLPMKKEQLNGKELKKKFLELLFLWIISAMQIKSWKCYFEDVYSTMTREKGLKSSNLEDNRWRKLLTSCFRRYLRNVQEELCYVWLSSESNE